MSISIPIFLAIFVAFQYFQIFFLNISCPAYLVLLNKRTCCYCQSQNPTRGFVWKVGV